MVFAETGSSFRSEPGVRIVSLPAVDTFLAPIAYTIVLQLLAYNVAVHKGTDVDQPRNLAKSVTTDLGVAGRDDYFGYGLINAYKAV